MTVSELKFDLANKLRDLEIHRHGDVKSKSLYEQRMTALNEMLESVETALQENHDQGLMDMKFRIKHSIRIMELANTCGLITEP